MMYRLFEQRRAKMSQEIPYFYNSLATLDKDDETRSSSKDEEENTGESLGNRNLTFQHLNGDETDGCLSTAALVVIRGVMATLLDRIIYEDLRDNCHGCAIDHPSQLQHACLFEPEAYYLHMNAFRLLKKLFKPWLKYTLVKALKLCGLKNTPSLEKILGIAEAIICDWRDEPSIKSVLSEAKGKTIEIWQRPSV